jgi:ATP-dependent Clp protease ATP-binding subunit ClpA
MISTERLSPLILVAVSRAREDDRNEVELIHLLSALARDNKSAALLAELGVDVVAFRTAVERRRLGEDSAQDDAQG